MFGMHEKFLDWYRSTRAMESSKLHWYFMLSSHKSRPGAGSCWYTALTKTTHPMTFPSSNVGTPQLFLYVIVNTFLIRSPAAFAPLRTIFSPPAMGYMINMYPHGVPYPQCTPVHYWSSLFILANLSDNLRPGGTELSSVKMKIFWNRGRIFYINIFITRYLYFLDIF